MVTVKICGITNLEDGIAAAEAGADLLGFVFYPPSPRYIEPARAAWVISQVRESVRLVRFVGVFVNAELPSIRSIMDQAQLDFVQLHGNELVETVRALSPRAFKSLRPRDSREARSLVSLYQPALCDKITPAFIVDAFDANQFGGTGVRANWDIAAGIARGFPILLAGGLNADTVGLAISTVHPWGVDVSSGVERAPGLKDHSKVRRFIDAARRGGI